MIEPVSIAIIDMVMDIYKAATAYMIKQGIMQWDELYPDRQTVLGDLEAGTMYGFFDDELCAVMALNTDQSPEYSGVDWRYKDENPLVLHRLCVSPDKQNRGIAKMMMFFVDEFAEAGNSRAIRLDAFKENPAPVHLYKKLGYRAAGTVNFRKGEFYCFEKKTVHYCS